MKRITWRDGDYEERATEVEPGKFRLATHKVRDDGTVDEKPWYVQAQIVGVSSVEYSIKRAKASAIAFARQENNRGRLADLQTQIRHQEEIDAAAEKFGELVAGIEGEADKTASEIVVAWGELNALRAETQFEVREENIDDAQAWQAATDRIDALTAEFVAVQGVTLAHETAAPDKEVPF